MSIDVTLSFPIFKSEKFVERAFTNAISQDFENIEILIIDNGSSDNSRVILDSLIEKYNGRKTVRVIRIENNIGLGNARNKAIEQAKGEYLYFMDSDDTISTDCISSLLSDAKKYHTDLTIGSYRKVNKNGNEIDRYELNKRYFDNNLNIVKAFFKDKLLPLPAWNKLYKLSFLRDNNITCYPKHINEDMIFSVKVFLSASTCFVSSKLTYNYFVYQESANRANDKYWSEEYINQISEVASEYKKYLETNCKDKDIRQIFGLWVSKYISYLSVKTLRSKIVSSSLKNEMAKRISKMPPIPMTNVWRTLNSPIDVGIYFFIRLPYCIKRYFFQLYNKVR